MNILLFSTLFLLLTLPTTQHAMENPFKKKYVRYYDVQSEILLSDENEQIYEGDWLSEESSSNQQSIELETISQEPKKPWNIINHPIILPEEINVDILLKLDLKTFFAMLKTDTIRYATCSKILIQRFLLEKRYNEELLKNIPAHLNSFPIETHTTILDIDMLLMTAAKAGYTEDFRILFNRPSIVNTISDDTLHTLFIIAIKSAQVGITKQLVSYNDVEGKFTSQELKEYLEQSDSEEIKKLKKKSKKSKVYNFIKIFYPYH